jgi:uncharacterized surface protein with fasciclin (FAS1) repeats
MVIRGHYEIWNLIMNITTQILRRSFVGVAGVGLIAALSACATPTTTSGTSPDTTVAESPTDTTAPSVSPSVTDSPAANQSPGAAGSETLAQVLDSDASFSTLKQAVEAAGLQDQLAQSTPVTVLAPNNQAFESLPAGTLDRLLLPENRETLRKVLSYHLIPGAVTSADITPGQVNSAEGQPLTLARDSSGVTVNGAKVVTPDISASNGVIHSIDQVLLPPDVTL